MLINKDLMQFKNAFCRYEQIQGRKSPPWVMWLTVSIISALFWAIVFVAISHADIIDLDRIAIIESSGNPKAISKDGGYGLYQITAIALADYNHYHSTTVKLEAMLNPSEAKKVASWLFEVRIPQLLNHYGIKDTVENRIRVYNSGIGTVIKGRTPHITKRYIQKYKEMR